MQIILNAFVHQTENAQNCKYFVFLVVLLGIFYNLSDSCFLFAYIFSNNNDVQFDMAGIKIDIVVLH